MSTSELPTVIKVGDIIVLVSITSKEVIVKQDAGSIETIGTERLSVVPDETS